MNRLNVARMQSPGLDTAILVLKGIVILAGVTLAAHALIGCGGAPFEVGGAFAEDAGKNVPDGADDPLDDGGETSSRDAAGDGHQSTLDGGNAPETGVTESGAPETGPIEASPVETGPTCTPFTGDINYCTVNDPGAVPRWLVLESVGVAPGGGITVLNCVAAKTPDACTCLETYDCACIRPAWTCSDGTAPVGCVDGPVVAVQCQ